MRFGFLRADAELDEKSTAEMTELIHSFRAESLYSFTEPLISAAISERMTEKLIFSGVDRVLTSGRRGWRQTGRKRRDTEIIFRKPLETG